VVAGGFGEEGSEGGADGAFVKGVLVFEFLEGGVIGGDGFAVRGGFPF
jgi:hypothetical protein